MLWLVDPRGPLWVFSAAALALAWGVMVERRWPQLTRHDVPVAGLPAALDGLRVVHLSDLHWDDHTSPARMHAIFNQVNALRPDLVVLTGDLITHYRRHIAPCAAAIGRLRGRLGVHAVLGNHDHWASGRQMADALRSVGVNVMMNEHVLVEDGLWLVGVDDPHLRRADLDRALFGIPESDGLPRLLLAHSPDIMEDAEGRVDLVLTGHTHGGQVRFPVVGPLLHATRHAVGREHVVGFRRRGHTLCFTNRGLGTVLIPIRFNCRPEVALITLRVEHDQAKR
ncbi:MAG: metallophosphoesterase [Proteobacteria bacterium]|nr:metallophosphoesterase [Pseudomonadota bacterium]